MRRRGRSFGRNVHGVLLLDKPIGITSNDALQRVKQLFRARKAGHTGSLDPLASGMLPICLGEGTKFSSFLLDADKHYRVVCKLGIKTSTGDAEGEVIEERPVPALDGAMIESVLAGFRGEIEQIPPMYSALKHEGKRLYELARQGLEVERKPRPVTIYALEYQGLEGDELSIHVHCSKGTYVRTLAEDIGERLGCGAHVSVLRRQAVGPYGEEGMVTLETLEGLAKDGFAALDALLLPLESALGNWPELQLTEDSAFYVKQGQPVQVPKAPSSGWVRLYNKQHEFIGVGEIQDDGKVAPRRLVSTA